MKETARQGRAQCLIGSFKSARYSLCIGSFSSMQMSPQEKSVSHMARAAIGKHRLAQPYSHMHTRTRPSGPWAVTGLEKRKHCCAPGWPPCTCHGPRCYSLTGLQHNTRLLLILIEYVPCMVHHCMHVLNSSCRHASMTSPRGIHHQLQSTSNQHGHMWSKPQEVAG